MWKKFFKTRSTKDANMERQILRSKSARPISAIGLIKRTTGHQVIIKQGYLAKLPENTKYTTLKKPEKLWFVFGSLNGYLPFLDYYANEETVYAGVPSGTIDMKECLYVLRNQFHPAKSDYVFTIVLRDKRLSLACKSRTTMQEWCSAIEYNLQKLGIINSVGGENDYLITPVRRSNSLYRDRQTSRPLPPLPPEPVSQGTEQVEGNQENNAVENIDEPYLSMYSNTNSIIPPREDLTANRDTDLHGINEENTSSVYITSNTKDNSTSSGIQRNTPENSACSGRDKVNNIESGVQFGEAGSKGEMHLLESINLHDVESTRQIGSETSTRNVEKRLLSSRKIHPNDQNRMENTGGIQDGNHTVSCSDKFLKLNHESKSQIYSKDISEKLYCTVDRQTRPSSAVPLRPVASTFANRSGIVEENVLQADNTASFSLLLTKNSSIEEHVPGLNFNSSLVSSSVTLVREIESKGCLELVISQPINIQRSFDLVEYSDAVWIAGWNTEEMERLGIPEGVFHIGDQLLSVNETPIGPLTRFSILRRRFEKSKRNVISLNRMPHARLILIKHQHDSSPSCLADFFTELGLVMIEGTWQVKNVTSGGLVSKSGLPPKAQTLNGKSICNWWITEVNHKNILSDDIAKVVQIVRASEESYISFLFQPADLLKKLIIEKDSTLK